MHQLGHTDPAFTLRVYAHVMRRSRQERAKLKALVEEHDYTPDADLGQDEAERP
jgi:hypothetical protein